MSKAVLISIRPEWCEKIASGQKTIEVRKTRPKIETPFKCYIYCTKPKIYNPVSSLYLDELYRLPTGEIKYGSSMDLVRFPDQWNKDNFLNGKVIGEFVCDNIGLYKYGGAFSENRMCFSLRVCSGLSIDELKKYASGKDVYGWHISDLVMYDKPRELRDYRILDRQAVKYCPYRSRTGQPEYVTKHGGWIKGGYLCDKSETDWCYPCYTKPITCPPQSWCYVEELRSSYTSHRDLVDQDKLIECIDKSTGDNDVKRIVKSIVDRQPAIINYEVDDGSIN